MVPRPTGGGEGGRRPDRGGVGPEAWSGAELGVPPPSSGRVARRERPAYLLPGAVWQPASG